MPPAKENLTADEAKQLEEAFKDADFLKLMAEYISEISDPKHRAEQEEYIAMLESQNEVPDGKTLVRPSRYVNLLYSIISYLYPTDQKYACMPSLAVVLLSN